MALSHHMASELMNRIMLALPPPSDRRGRVAAKKSSDMAKKYSIISKETYYEYIYIFIYVDYVTGEI